MHDRFDDRPEGEFGRKLYNARFEKYRENIAKIESCFKRYGVRRVQGPPGESLRRIAVERIVDMQDMMGADRLPISDHYAVVPNYYGTYIPFKEEDDEEFVYSKTTGLMTYNKAPVHSTGGTMRYVVALELVIRDFRNYEALYEPLAKGNLRYLRHPCNTPLPPVEPEEKARVFDIPLGYISQFQYYPLGATLHMSVRGQYGELMKMDIEVNRDPDEVAKERLARRDIEKIIEDDIEQVE